MDENNEPLSAVAVQLGVDLPDTADDERRATLVEFVNHLIVHDFDKLVSLLYRLDVSEKKINRLLQGFPSVDAAEMITNLMIEREQEKIISRKTFRSPGDELPGEEKW
jgi:hypothetical protein